MTREREKERKLTRNLTVYVIYYKIENISTVFVFEYMEPNKEPNTELIELEAFFGIDETIIKKDLGNGYFKISKGHCEITMFDLEA